MPRTFDLIAQGAQLSQRWRKRLRDREWHLIGREPGVFGVEWDSKISRRHARIRRARGGVEVEKLPDATNPIFFEGKEASQFFATVNQHFVIGQTRFLVVEGEAVASMNVPSPIHQRTFSDQFLRQLDYRDAQHRLNVLNRLPEIIAGAADEEQLYDRLTSVLLEGVPMANLVAIVEIGEQGIIVKHWDSREALKTSFVPSESLIRQALNERETVLHVWSPNEASRSDYTVQQNADWAYVCPLGSATGCQHAIYVSGEVSRAGQTITTELLHDDLKFTQLVGSTYTNVIDLEALQRRQAALRSFFAPVVMEALAGRSAEEVLEPRACQLSVMFCDLRGFSATSEQMSENLLDLLNRVSKTLGVMTRCILDHGGVVGDFHGDAVMGFWGWPLDQPDLYSRAVRTAIEIATQFDGFYASEAYPVSQFLMGLGIASGTAVAGRIGTSDQVKVTAFGPVVNLASRLEGMTRYFKVPILCDENTAREIEPERDRLQCRIRRLAKVIPHGFHRRTDVYQVMPTEGGGIHWSEQHLIDYDRALELFEGGRWSEARSVFESLDPNDLAIGFVLDYLMRTPEGPGPDWNSAIPVPGK